MSDLPVPLTPEPKGRAIVATSDLALIYMRDDRTAAADTRAAAGERWYLLGGTGTRIRLDLEESEWREPYSWPEVLDRTRGERLMYLHRGAAII